MGEKIDYVKMTAPCGLDCFNCPMYLKDDQMCKGCRNEDGTIGFMGMKEPCNVYKCISNKNINFCYECEDFPCDFLHPYADKASIVPHNTKVFNLCLIKKMGLEKWAEEKAKIVKNTYFKEKWKI
ncbi:MAG: DUF3795 domain-containing protein [Promethearchaeota archaeon]